ncbi:hypothetical protein CHU98_g3787 [Xylaria longipes]|nr:hypothetical protein CHU98_g3787 [Xylaria longipes]
MSFHAIQLFPTSERADDNDGNKIPVKNRTMVRPLDAIKVSTLLYMYNVFGKATVSLAYADGAWNVRQVCQRRQLDEITDLMWLDYHKAWSTLIFLSSLLSATLGYKAGDYRVI